MSRMKKILPFLLLHGIIFLYSLCGICSKTAAGYPFLSFNWCLFYGLMILLLGIYAILWQQILKMIPLNVAYANKAVCIIWGMLWGIVFFSEALPGWGQIAGAVMVLGGVILMVSGGEGHE